MTTPPGYSVEQAIIWGNAVELVYDMYKSDPSCLHPSQPTNGFPEGWTMIMDITVGPCKYDGVEILDQEFIGFMAQNNADASQYAVVFRGTVSDFDWLFDAEVGLTPFTDVPNGGNAEQGFTTLYNSVLGTLTSTGESAPLAAHASRFASATSFIVAGHSLGGALALLYAPVFAYNSAGATLDVYTFAAPMMGDQQFVMTFEALVTNNYRIVNQMDIVPLLPGLIHPGYVKLNGEIPITSLGNPNIHQSLACNHELLVYLYLLGASGIDLGTCGTSVSAAQATLAGASASRPAMR